MQPEEELERKKHVSVWNSIKAMRDNSVKQSEENSERYSPLKVIFFSITYIQILNGNKLNIPTQENIYRTKQ